MKMWLNYNNVFVYIVANEVVNLYQLPVTATVACYQQTATRVESFA